MDFLEAFQDELEKIAVSAEWLARKGTKYTRTAFSRDGISRNFHLAEVARAVREGKAGPSEALLNKKLKQLKRINAEALKRKGSRRWARKIPHKESPGQLSREISQLEAELTGKADKNRRAAKERMRAFYKNRQPSKKMDSNRPRSSKPTVPSVLGSTLFGPKLGL